MFNNGTPLRAPSEDPVTNQNARRLQKARPNGPAPKSTCVLARDGPAPTSPESSHPRNQQRLAAASVSLPTNLSIKHRIVRSVPTASRCFRFASAVEERAYIGATPECQTRKHVSADNPKP
jgi:hypothetical protein